MTWKLVPVIPPPAMVKAGELHTIGTPHTVWKHMLSASPDPTTDEALVERVAEAIYGGDWHSLPDEAWLPNHGSLQDGKTQYRFMALAAIRAMEKKP